MTRIESTSRLRDLAMGMRFSISGGKEGLLRTTLTALGVGAATALLLIAAALPHMKAERSERVEAVQAQYSYTAENIEASDSTLLLAHTSYKFRGITVMGNIVQADGAKAQAPPGLPKFPAVGELYVSPALYELMTSDDYELLKPRLDYEITGVIDKSGVVGPADYLYYLGVDTLTENEASRITGYGVEPTEDDGGGNLLLTVLGVVAIVVLLLPVAIFVGVAARFGGERRDRRLAALRLLGADRRMVRWMAAGESLAGALIGLVVGAVMYFFGRKAIAGVNLWGISAYESDLVPSPFLAVLVTVGVVLVAIATTLLSMSRVSIEPLGVVRHATVRRRRLWWRVIPFVLGVGILLGVVWMGVDSTGNTFVVVSVISGVLLLLLGLAAVLPWTIETVVARLQGGRLSWQLGMRRLQMSVDGTGRAINGIVVAVAGAIALQLLFGAASDQYVEEIGTQNLPDAEASVYTPESSDSWDLDSIRDELSDIEKLSVRSTYQEILIRPAGQADSDVVALVSDCQNIIDMGQPLPDCRDGDVFFISTGEFGGVAPEPGATWEILTEEAGQDDFVPEQEWIIPADIRTESISITQERASEYMVITPKVFEGIELPVLNQVILFDYDETNPDVIEHARNAGFIAGWEIRELATQRIDDDFAEISLAIRIGVLATIVLVGGSLLVSTIEQLQDRRKLMSVLVAFGVRRRSLCGSVLWQTIVPVLVGLVLALAVGVVLGTLLMTMLGVPLNYRFGEIGFVLLAGSGMVAAVTALSIPPLWRMMRPAGLRTE